MVSFWSGISPQNPLTLGRDVDLSVAEKNSKSVAVQVVVSYLLGSVIQTLSLYLLAVTVRGREAS